MALRRSYTAVVERNALWQGDFATEPYEAGWASEAIFFLRALEVQILHDSDFDCKVHAQISADGIHWVDHGEWGYLPRKQGDIHTLRLSRFGGWLRLSGRLAPGEKITVLVALALKE